MGPRDAWAQTSANSLFAFLIVGVCGALLLGLLTYRFFPDAAAAAGTVGFVAAAALRGVWLSKRAQPEPDEYSNGNSRTEEEVRAALAKIEARQK